MPPITITNKNTWMDLLKILKLKKIMIQHAINKKNGMEIHPATSNNHRQITKELDKHGQHYYTFPLEGEKLLITVIRGLPISIDIEDIKNELIDMNFEVRNISRMYRKTTNKTAKQTEKTYMLLIYVDLRRNQQSKNI